MHYWNQTDLEIIFVKSPLKHRIQTTAPAIYPPAFSSFTKKQPNLSRRSLAGYYAVNNFVLTPDAWRVMTRKTYSSVARVGRGVAVCRWVKNKMTEELERLWISLASCFYAERFLLHSQIQFHRNYLFIYSGYKTETDRIFRYIRFFIHISLWHKSYKHVLEHGENILT